MSRARDLAAFVSNADGDIKFDTDTLFIDSSENRVGIGTQTPDRSLHIAGNPGMIVLEDTGGGADDKRAAVFADSGVFEIASKNDDDSTRLNDIFVADLGTGAIRMGDTGGTSTSRQKSFIISHQTGQSSEYGGLEFFRAHQNSQKVGASIMHVRPGSSLDDSDMVFKTSSTNSNATERWRITHNGHFKAATDGLGIDFSATEGSDASVSILSDYEEGFWTPVVRGGSSAGTYTTQYLSARYTKIGDRVLAETTIYVTGFNGSGTFEIAGLPFTNKGGNPGGLCVPQWNECPFATFSSDNQQVIGLIPSNNTYIHFRACDRVQGSSHIQLQCGSSTVSYLRLSMHYEAA